MRGEIEVESPDAVEVTLTLTMTLGDWKALRGSLCSKYPDWQLGNVIGQAVSKIEARFALAEKVGP